MVGAFSSDLLLQTFGVAMFLWPIALGMLGMRWWRFQPVNSPLPKLIGAAALLTFASALFGLLPWHWRWLHAVPIEGIAGRIVGDFLIHYFNLTGAYIISLSVMAAAMYVSTAFSFNALQLWCETRFAFAYALHNRFQDWREARAKKKAARDLDKRKLEKPVVTSQLLPRRSSADVKAAPMTPASKAVSIYEPDAPFPEAIPSGIERVNGGEIGPEVGVRADVERKPKTILPRAAGSFKLPSSALLHRPDAQESIDEEHLKVLAQLLVEKCA